MLWADVISSHMLLLATENNRRRSSGLDELTDLDLLEDLDVVG